MPSAIFVVPQTDFREEELSVTRDVLLKDGWTCAVASRAVGTCRGMHGGEAESSMTLAEVRVDDYDAVVFVGGVGARMYVDDPEAHRIAREADAKKKILAAICIAPAILAHAGVLSGRVATAYGSEVKTLDAAGARVPPTSVAVDRKLVTADGPRAARDFGEAIARVAHPQRRATTQSIRMHKGPGA